MAFCPIWKPTTAPALMPEDETKELVAAAANQLVLALDRAERLSDQWQNEPLGYALVDAAMTECLAQLVQTGRWGRDNQIPSSILWKTAGHKLEVGALQLRARTKPLGYAGDYQMLMAIIQDECCDHSLGRLFDRYFQNQAAPQAVRSRTQQTACGLANYILNGSKESYHILSVGAGTGVDIEQGLQLVPPAARRQARITLLDLDDESLAFAANRLRKVVANEQICCTRENLFRLKRARGAEDRLGTPDFIVCSGLFDYLEDVTARGLLSLLWQQLATGGLLLVGNFAPGHPTRAYMEWIGNWYLCYRTPKELAALADAAGIPPEDWSVRADRTGADLFLECRKL